MTHRGPFQPLPFCDSVILSREPWALGTVTEPWAEVMEELRAPNRLPGSYHVLPKSVIEGRLLCLNISIF